MIARAQDLARLEQALRPPKARGGFGELLLENLLRDRLAARRLRDPAHVLDRRPRRRRDPRRTGSSPIDSKFPLDNFELMAAHERRCAAAAPREGVRARRQGAHRRDRGEVHPARPRAPTTSRSCTYPAEAIYYELVSGKTGAAARVRAREARLPGLGDHIHRLSAGDRNGPQGSPDRADRARSDGVLRGPAEATSASSARTSSSSASTSRMRRASTRAADKRLDRFETRLERAADLKVEAGSARRGARAPAARSTPRPRTSPTSPRSTFLSPARAPRRRERQSGRNRLIQQTSFAREELDERRT